MLLHSERASLESSDDEDEDDDEEEEEEDQGWLGWGGDDQGCVSDLLFLLALLGLSQIFPEHSSQPYLQLSYDLEFFLQLSRQSWHPDSS